MLLFFEAGLVDLPETLPMLTDVLFIEFLLLIGGFLRTYVIFKHFLLPLLLSLFYTITLPALLFCCLLMLDNKKELDFFI